jgi:hypothetical protein
MAQADRKIARAAAAMIDLLFMGISFDGQCPLDSMSNLFFGELGDDWL